MEYVTKVAVISLERTKWVHKGYSGLKGRLGYISYDMDHGDISRGNN